MTDLTSEESSDWILDQGVLRPPDKQAHDLHLWLSKRKGNDSSISFELSPPAAEPLEILSSRLEYAGGPLAAIYQQPFAEKQSQKVTLSAEDDFVTFRVIRDYLYMNPISPIIGSDWEDVTLNVIIRVICAAHRWQLKSLVAGFCNILSFYKMLGSDETVLNAIAIARIPDIPQETLVYFWTTIGQYYPLIAIHPHHEVSNSENMDVEENGNNKIDKVNAKQTEAVNYSKAASPSLFPDLWALALNQKMTSYLLHSTVTHMMDIGEYEDYDDLDDESYCSRYHNHLEIIVLGFLEPRISDDSYFLHVLTLLRWPLVRWTLLVQNDTSYKRYSSRAMALVARHLILSNVARDEFRATWEIDPHSVESLYGIKRQFLFPMSKVYGCCKRARYADVSRGAMRGECEAGISFAVSIAKMRVVWGFSIDTSWSMIDMGYLEKNFSSGRIKVKIIDNKCKCLRWHPLTSHSTNDVIVERVYKFHEAEGFQRLPISKTVLAEYRAAHGNKCRVTISVEVRDE